MAKSTPVVLIVDDEDSVRTSLRYILSLEYRVLTATNVREAEELLNNKKIEIVLLDISLPDNSGITLLKKIRTTLPQIQVIMVTGTRDIATAVESIKLGAYDYITKPFTSSMIQDVVSRAIKEAGKFEDSIFCDDSENRFFGEIVGKSPVMIKALKLVSQVVNTSTTVLILGESGVGKELIAKAIHFNGLRKKGPFVPIHMASLPENLLEAELFGYEKGAFTGAKKSKPGLIELAEGGTVFLDEVGDIPLSIQVKLLRVLQEKEVRRIGSTTWKKVDVRFISATHRNLEELMRQGSVREDLYYRLGVVQIKIPPLRERKEDIPILCSHILKRLKRKIPTPVEKISDGALDLFMRHNWPGNVRELENVIEHIINFCNNKYVLPKDVPEYIKSPVKGVRGKLSQKVESYEKELILEALEQSNGIISRAANILGTTRRVLQYKMEKLGISREQIRK